MTVMGKHSCNLPYYPAVKIFRSKIERNIDDAIEKAMDFKPNVLALEKYVLLSR
jgi:hypothetical protein